MYWKKKIGKKINFGASVFLILLLVIPSIFAKEIDINSIDIKWSLGLGNGVDINCNLENVYDYNIGAYDNTVHFDVRAECNLVLMGQTLSIFFTRRVYCMLVCYDGNEIIGKSDSQLWLGDGIGTKGYLIAPCVLNSYENERKLIRCEVIITPCIEIVLPFTAICILRLPLTQEICSCIVELNITHV